MLALLCVGCVLASGCALVAHGSTQEVMIKVYPENANLTVDGKPVKAGAVALARDKTHFVRAEAKGHEPGTVVVHTTTSTGWAIADGVFAASGLLFYYVGAIVTSIPLVVDSATGALDHLEPSQVVLRLRPTEARPAASPRAPPSPGALAVHCPACGVPFEDAGHRYCAWCGKARGRLPEKASAVDSGAGIRAPATAASERHCPACGVPFEEDLRFCGWCGRKRGAVRR
jgi:hypothetical protein